MSIDLWSCVYMYVCMYVCMNVYPRSCRQLYGRVLMCMDLQPQLKFYDFPGWASSLNSTRCLKGETEKFCGGPAWRALCLWESPWRLFSPSRVSSLRCCALSWLILVPIWANMAHLGVKLANFFLGPQLGRSCRPDTAQQASRWSSGRVPTSLNFNDCSRILKSNFKDFQSIWNNVLEFSAAGSALWRLGARSASDMFVCLYLCMYLCMYVGMCVCLCLCLRLCLCLCLCYAMFMFMFVYVRTYVHMFIFLRRFWKIVVL